MSHIRYKHGSVIIRHVVAGPAFLRHLAHFSTHLAHQARQSSSLQNDLRQRLSKLWTPTGGISPTSNEDGHSKLIRAGFIRQAHSGIFHMLPLGRRVQHKIEKLVDKYMQSLGASRLDLSSISSQDLWSKSGRLSKNNSELFLFEDRRKAQYLLSPTHEEEITSLVSNTTQSYKELPVRLYQITRKYRDELRPRHGLLRSREFVMKDLYTFDVDSTTALATYQEVRNAYRTLFDELHIPYLVADADSGDMGGNLSHEYHFPTHVGEDNVISCQSCEYVANEELAASSPTSSSTRSSAIPWAFAEAGRAISTTQSTTSSFSVWRGVSRDRGTLVNVWYALDHSMREINTHAVKRVVTNLDSAVENPVALWDSFARAADSTKEPRDLRIVNLIDSALPADILNRVSPASSAVPIHPREALYGGDVVNSTISVDPIHQQPLELLRIRDGDSCPRCQNGVLKVQRAIELGHTFFLGTRYSEPLAARVSVPASLHELSSCGSEKSTLYTNGTKGIKTESLVPMQMGCHGIGISRMIGAVAETLSDERGLNWPRAIAPFEAVLIAAKGNEDEVACVYDELVTNSSAIAALDLVLDDRSHSFAWKMHDADLVGYPVIVVVGKTWKVQRSCEVQCRLLNVRKDVQIEHLRCFIDGLLAQL